MKNIYNNEKFFESYSQMTRSQQGLDGAGEWQTLKRLLPDFKKKRVLNLWVAVMAGIVFTQQNTAQLQSLVLISPKKC